jgi:hypothetical protein
MASPVQGFVDAYRATLAGTASQNITFSFAITAEYEAIVPFGVFYSGNISLGPEVYFYRTGSGGQGWESEGNLATVFSDPGDGAANRTMRRCVYLTNGQYLIRVLTGTGTTGTWTVELQTARVIGTYA